MPELEQPWGYPLALALMLSSVAAPLIYFRRKGWMR
jgi:magnesium transporter